MIVFFLRDLRALHALRIRTFCSHYALTRSACFFKNRTCFCEQQRQMYSGPQRTSCKLTKPCCKSKHQKCTRALKEGGVGTRSSIFFERQAVILFLGLCDYSDKFPKMFCSSCGMECPSTANSCHQCGQQLHLSQVSNKAASSVDKEKLLKMYFQRDILTPN